MWFVLWQFVQYIPIFYVIVWGFWTNTILLLCGTNRLFIASTLEIRFSQTKVASLCCYKVFLFMPTVVTCKYGCNPHLKTIVGNYLLSCVEDYWLISQYLIINFHPFIFLLCHVFRLQIDLLIIMNYFESFIESWLQFCKSTIWLISHVIVTNKI